MVSRRLRFGATTFGPATKLSDGSGSIAGVARQRKNRKDEMGTGRHFSLKPVLRSTWKFHSL